MNDAVVSGEEGNAFDMDAFLKTLPEVVDPDAESGSINAEMHAQELKQTKIELDTLKQQYRSLEGRTSKLSALDSKYAESQRLAKEQGARILELTELVAKATNQKVEDILTPEEQKTFAKSRPIVEKIAGSTAKNAVDDALKGLDGKFTKQDDRISGLEKSLQKAEDKGFRTAVRAAHGDLDKFLSSEVWEEAKQEMQPVAGRTLGELFADALDNRNAEQAINIIKMVKEKTGFGEKGGDNEYSLLTVPDGGSAAAEQNKSSAESKTFKSTDPDDWNDMRFRAKTITKEQHEALLAQFEKAELEGRVV